MKALVALVIAVILASANPESEVNECLQISFKTTKDRPVSKVLVDRWIMLQQFADIPVVVANPKLELTPDEKGKATLAFYGLSHLKLRVENQEIVRMIPILHEVELEAEGNSLYFLVFRNAIIFLPQDTQLQNLTLVIEYRHPALDKTKSGAIEVIVAKDDDKERAINQLMEMIDKKIPRDQGTKKPIKVGEQVVVEPAATASGIAMIKLGKGDRVWEVRQKRPFLIRFNLPINDSTKTMPEPTPLKLPEKPKGPIA